MDLSTSRGARLLIGPGGLALRVDATGVLIGRAPACDLVLSDSRASSRHAMVRLGASGPELVPLGKNPTYVNLEAVTGVRKLVAGDRVDVPGHTLVVEVDAAAVESPTVWVIRTSDGPAFGLRRTPWTAGGGPDDDLRVDGWPAGALRLRGVQGALVAELAAAGSVNGSAFAAGDRLLVVHGTSMTIGGVTLTATTEDADGQPTTIATGVDAGPEEIAYERLEQGANLLVRIGGEPIEVRLDEELALLVDALWPPELQPGSFVADAAVAAAVWPGEPHRDGHHVGHLVTRLGDRLIAAGANPFRVVERVVALGSTRLRAGGATRATRT